MFSESQFIFTTGVFIIEWPPALKNELPSSGLKSAGGWVVFGRAPQRHCFLSFHLLHQSAVAQGLLDC